jgi:hypothetical protein
MELDHTDAVDVQIQKMLAATNEVNRLIHEELIPVGTQLNAIKGKYEEIKVRIKGQKEIINSCKISIRAEGSHL